VLWVVSESQRSYQTKPVGFLGADILHDIPICHQLGNHRKFLILWLDVDGNKFEDVRVGYVHPENGFLAERLDPICQQ
jgi:hypothetical protein